MFLSARWNEKERNEVKLDLNYPPATRGKIVVWSLIASFPFPGTAWHRLQFLAGLRRLGFDVWYIEETDITVMNPSNLWASEDYMPNVEYLARLMELIGMGDRWVFRPPGQFNICLGSLDLHGMYQLYRDADLVINHTGAQVIRPEHRQIKCLAYIETDPVLNQIEVVSGNQSIINQLDAHNLLFTYGSNIGTNTCTIPVGTYKWFHTRPAICIDWWSNWSQVESAEALTTIATWKHFGKQSNLNGRKLRWTKRDEFLRFINVAKNSKIPLELCIGNINAFDLELLKRNGWRIKAAKNISNISQYRDYIQKSLGEFTVSKEQYVYSNSGWFSDRSATFLASGRPVITQDTGFGNSLPTGEGLFSFSNEEEALAAIDHVASDYQHHSNAALEIAHEYFSSERVLRDMLSTIGLL